MDNSAEKSDSKVDAATVVAAPEKPLEKGKREAEDAIENEVLSAKKHKVEEKESKVKTKKKVVQMKVEISSEEDSSSSESEQQIKVSAKNGHVGSDSDDKNSCLEEEANAAKKKPAVTAKNEHIAISKKKDESSHNSETFSEDESCSGKDVAATKQASASLSKEGHIAAAHKTDESSKNSESSSEDQTCLDDVAAASETPTTPSVKKSVVSTQKKEKSSSNEFDSDYETCSDKNVATAKKAPVAPTKQGLVLATKKKDESSSGEENAGEDDVTVKDISAAVTKKKNVSSEESESDNETRSSDDDPKTPFIPKDQTTGPKTLFVGNLSFSVEQEDVEHFFKAAGEVVNIRFGLNPDESFRGFGYVEFASAEAAEKALHELNGKELLHRPVRLDLMRERGSFTPYSGKDTQSFQQGGRAQGQRIFVSGFNKFDGEDQIRRSLEEHFGSCGEITRVSIPRDQDGAVKGIALVDFKDSDALNQALELNGSEFGGSTLLVEEAKPRRDSLGCGRGRGRRSGWDFGGRSGWRDFGGRGGSRRGGGAWFGSGGGWIGGGGRGR